MKPLNALFILLFLFSQCEYGDSSKILFLTPMGSKSHKIFFMGITEALAKRGHQVTMVSGFKPEKQIHNIRQVVIWNFTLDTMLENIFEDDDVIVPIIQKTPDFCVDGLKQPHIQALKYDNYDAIIMSLFFDSCYLSFVHHYKVPLIYASPAGLTGPFNTMIGNIDFPSITGSKFLEPGFPLSFAQRLGVTLINLIFEILTDYYLEPNMRSLCIENGLCPRDLPPIKEFHKNASMVIINSVRTLEYPPRPAMPNVIYAGGAHIKPPKEVPQDLEEWIQGSGEEGFIFFSLGSALNPDYLPEEYRQILVKVFGSLKQRVLWKWNQETMPDLPKNVKLQKWLPQNDLLGHPKVRLFITHGGLLSTLEASYNGVPVIGMPVFADQKSNMKEVQKEGWGRVIQWKELEEDTFRKLILEVLNSEKMLEIAKKRSVLMKDRLVPPDEEAAYWVEYVIRHKGAPHIMSPVHMMKWYEIYNVDVWAFIILATTTVLYITWIVIKFIFRKCFGIGKSKTNKRKKE